MIGIEVKNISVGATVGFESATELK